MAERRRRTAEDDQRETAGWCLLEGAGCALVGCLPWVLAAAVVLLAVLRRSERPAR